MSGPGAVRLRVQYAGGPWTWALILDGREVIAADQAPTWTEALADGLAARGRALAIRRGVISGAHGPRWRPWRRRCGGRA